MEIRSINFGKLQFKQEVPSEPGYLRIPGSKAFSAVERFASVFYQKYETESYKFWLTHYRPTFDQDMYVHREGHYIGFKVVIKKHIRYRCDNGQYLLKQGQFLFAYGHEIDTIFFLKGNEEYQVFDMIMTEEFIRGLNIGTSIMTRFLENVSAGKRTKLSYGIPNSSVKMLDSLDTLLERPADQAAAAKVIHELVESAQKHRLNDLPEYRIERVYNARDIIRSDLSRNIANPSLARIVGINSRDFKTDFVQVFAMPPHQYLLYERVKAAAKLLLHERHRSIDEIAVLSGFRNAVTLYPAFKKYIGVTPNMWRKKNGI